MRGLGTLINVLCIVAGGVAGALFGAKLEKRVTETLMAAIGLAVVFLGVAGCMQEALVVVDGGLASTGTLMMIVSLAGGAVVGELIDIQGAVERFGAWLRDASGNAQDSSFVGAFVSASCTVCIGAMAIIGSIQDGVSGDYSVLVAKGLLDAVIVLVMTASLGKGCAFSAIPVGILQGAVTLAAYFVGPFMTQAALSYLTLVGSILIACVGLNLLRERQIRVANLLPALVIAVAWGFVG